MKDLMKITLVTDDYAYAGAFAAAVAATRSDVALRTASFAAYSRTDDAGVCIIDDGDAGTLAVTAGDPGLDV
jgi:hypothetical protein